jgi:hypothetical protein
VFVVTVLVCSLVALTTADRGFQLYYFEPRFAEYFFSFAFVVLIIAAIFGFITKNRR